VSEDVSKACRASAPACVGGSGGLSAVGPGGTKGCTPGAVSSQRWRPAWQHPPARSGSLKHPAQVLDCGVSLYPQTTMNTCRSSPSNPLKLGRCGATVLQLQGP
jgi:hypothetical protein